MNKNMVKQLQIGEIVNDWEIIDNAPKMAYWEVKCIHCGIIRFKNKFSMRANGCKCKAVEKQKNTMLKRYGVECASHSVEIRKKAKQTTLERYGVEYAAQSKEFREKAKQTNLERFGVEYAGQSEEVKERIRQTNLERFGVDNPRKSNLIKKKIRQTNLEKFGVEYPSQLESFKERKKQTNLKKLGVECPFQLEEVKERVKQTNLKRYGNSNYMQTEKGQEQFKNTCLKKYGVDNYAKTEECREKIKETCLDRYGVENAFQFLEIQEKIRQTNLDKYGMEHYLQTSEFRRKSRETCLDTYGVERAVQSEEIKEKIKQTNLDKYGVEHIAQLPENRYKLRDWCEENPHLLFQSKSELELLDLIQENYPSACKLKQEGYELDIFIPELNLGIEYNGLYWHSENHKSKNYHIEKTNYFKSKEIRVIHIWGHEWNSKREQVKSFLLSAINKNEYKIGARKCKFIFTDSKEEIAKAQELLENTHIQGKAHSVKYVVNAYHNKELIATATFGLHHRNSKQYVLSRFTTKTNYTIQGCLSKISKLAYENLRTPIISWADYRLSLGNGYEKAGWKFEELLRPDYFYFTGGEEKIKNIISKQSRQKKVMNTPKGMTEREHAELDGLVRIYDCGKIRFVYGG